ncbi:unnamed protein product [Gongylonema pulchrum]|uniref:Uncharacterized protein n=1 Tax=Gongylonema pulchrum TaxID=637853 RepID=A0A183DQT6_9BILA|nr:unnamed protein product [Gongylonema pulchrum]
MKYALRKLDDTKFKSHEVSIYCCSSIWVRRITVEAVHRRLKAVCRQFCTPPYTCGYHRHHHHHYHRSSSPLYYIIFLYAVNLSNALADYYYYYYYLTLTPSDGTDSKYVHALCAAAAAASPEFCALFYQSDRIIPAPAPDAAADAAIVPLMGFLTPTP